LLQSILVSTIMGTKFNLYKRLEGGLIMPLVSMTEML